MVTSEQRKNKAQGGNEFHEKLKGITRHDRIRNGIMRMEVEVKPLMKCTEGLQLKWFRHNSDNGLGETCKNVTREMVQKRPRASPRKH